MSLPRDPSRTPDGSDGNHAEFGGYDLFNMPPEADITAEEWAALSTPEKFERFHDANPDVYRIIVEHAREWRAAGKGKLGMSLLFGIVRWVIALRTQGDPLRINDHYVPYYSRLIMWQEVDLRELFDTRRATEADAWIADKRGEVA